MAKKDKEPEGPQDNMSGQEISGAEQARPAPPGMITVSASDLEIIIRRIVNDVHAERLPKEEPVHISNIMQAASEPIEVCPGKMTQDQLELEKFMNEKVLVLVHADSNVESVQVPCPNVNGVNQPFIRGKEQWVRRAFIEALARSRVINYVQKQAPTDLSNIQMVAMPAPTLTFSVLSDPNPRGRAWLDKILQERV